MEEDAFRQYSVILVVRNQFRFEKEAGIWVKFAQFLSFLVSIFRS